MALTSVPLGTKDGSSNQSVCECVCPARGFSASALLGVGLGVFVMVGAGLRRAGALETSVASTNQMPAAQYPHPQSK